MSRPPADRSVDDKHLAGQAAFDGFTVGQADIGLGHVHVATEKTIVFLPRHFKYFRAHRIDTDTARHVHRCTEHKTIQRAIGGGHRNRPGLDRGLIPRW